MTKFELDKLVREAMEAGRSKVFLRDGSGLYVRIREMKGGKVGYWMFDYALGRPKSFGKYKEKSLPEVRRELVQFKAELSSGGPLPAEKRKAARVEVLSMEAVCREWFQRKMAPGTVSDVYRRDIWRKLEVFILPAIGGRGIGEVTNNHLLECLRKIEADGKLVTVHRVFDILRKVFLYARGAGYTEVRPEDIASALPKQRKAEHFAGMTDPRELGEALRKLDAYEGGLPQYRIMLRILPHLALRVGSLVQARWEQIDMEAAIWTIPADAMKGHTGNRREFREPLSRQVLSMLEELRRFTGGSPFLFLSSRGKAPGKDVVNYHLREAGISPNISTPHGFRTTLSTLMRNELHLDDVIPELALAHKVGSATALAYSEKADRLQQRREAMQRWSDYLDDLKENHA